MGFAPERQFFGYKEFAKFFFGAVVKNACEAKGNN